MRLPPCSVLSKVSWITRRWTCVHGNRRFEDTAPRDSGNILCLLCHVRNIFLRPSYSSLATQGSGPDLGLKPEALSSGGGACLVHPQPIREQLLPAGVGVSTGAFLSHYLASLSAKGDICQFRKKLLKNGV